jgi:hypothetical protein
MPLDPQLRAWLDAGREAGVRPYQELGVDEARRLVDANAIGLFGDLEHVDTIEDIDAGGVRARAYRPGGGDNGVLVWLLWDVTASAAAGSSGESRERNRHERAHVARRRSSLALAAVPPAQAQSSRRCPTTGSSVPARSVRATRGELRRRLAALL